MSVELISALVSAFLAISLAVAAVVLGVRNMMVRNEKLWIRTQNQSSGPLDAIFEFVKRLLSSALLRFESVENVHARIKLDVVRADVGTTAEEFFADSIFEGLLVAVVGGLLLTLLFGPFAIILSILLGVGWALWMRPSMLNADGEKRSRAIYRRLPYALDLGVLVLQAGGTLRDALEQIAIHDDPFGVEVRTVLREVDSGAAQSAALLNMSNRVGIEALDAIVLAINRGEATGAPMVQTLTTQAELFRERRLQELEKLAVEAPTKMTFPNMMVMISVMIIVIAPVMVKLATGGLF